MAADGAVAFENDGRVLGQEPMQRVQQTLSGAARYAFGDGEPGSRGQGAENDFAVEQFRTAFRDEP